MATTEINKTKILVKVHEPLIAIMQHKIDAACLKRDAYLDKALRVEAEFLRKEITTPNSDKAKNYIAAQLGDLKLKPLNLLLSTETVDLINEVCKEKNVPRDAFMNRFFLLLIMSDTVLFTIFEELMECELGYDYDLRDAEEWLQGMMECYGLEISIRSNAFDVFNRSSVLDTIEEYVLSPFTRLRFFLYHFFGSGSGNYIYLAERKFPESRPSYLSSDIYLYPLRKNALQRLPNEYDLLKVDNALGFNTFMTDEQIEKQEALDAVLNKEMSEKGNQDKLLAAMLKEKQARAEKDQQARLAKAKSTGEAK